MTDLNLINGVRAWTNGVDVEPQAFQQDQAAFMAAIKGGD